MEQRRFGQTDLVVSRIGLGCLGLSGDWEPVDRQEAIRTLKRAFDLGMNCFDTAEDLVDHTGVLDGRDQAQAAAGVTSCS